VHRRPRGNLLEGDVSTRPEQTVDGMLAHCCCPLIQNPDNPKGIFSFATAVTSEAPAAAHNFKLLKIWPRNKKPSDEAEQDAPIYTHVSRGWDHTNLQWQKVVWPKLDCNLQPLQGHSTAAWRLDWQGGGRTEDVTIEDIEAQGPLTGMLAGSSMAVKTPTEGPEFQETAVKPDKGKARAFD
jgi:hypothetical protein